MNNSTSDMHADELPFSPAGNEDGEFAAPGGLDQSTAVGAGEGQEQNARH